MNLLNPVSDEEKSLFKIKWQADVYPPLFASAQFANNEDDNGDDDHHQKNSETHSGLKDIANDFARSYGH